MIQWQYDTSVTSNVLPWQASPAANCVITGTVPTDTEVEIPIGYVTYSASDVASLDLPKRSPITPPPPIPAWRRKLQKVIPFFAPRPEFHARSNPGGR